ncbi:sigma-70 family RNA polymerase sigma factor [Rhodococcus aerolatus]
MTTTAPDVRPGPPADFATAVEPFRRELLAHCYRMSGSRHDAEDLLQDVLVRAWKAWDRFEGRSSVRTWLHRIATNTCLTALEGRARRPLPTGLGAPSSDPTDDLVERGEVPWLEPLPTDPADTVADRESVRLAFVAALQHLPTRQRAVLVLREVLQLSAAETAEALGTTVAGVNSALQRARAQLAELDPQRDALVDPDTPATRALLAAYVACFERYDIAGLVAVLTREVVWEMPPFDSWYVGPEAVVGLIGGQCPAEGPGDMVLLPTRANGQPAYGLYMRGPDGQHHPFQLHVLGVTAAGVGHVAAFFDASPTAGAQAGHDGSALFAAFGLPPHPPHA